MAAPEIAFGIRRVRTSTITQSATKMTTVATVRDCINSLHFSVQRRPDVRGAAVRPPLSRFHPTHVGPGSGRGAVDHDLSLAPQRADISGDDDGYDNRDDADGRQGNPVLREILGGLLAKQPRQKIQHPSPSLAAPWADRTGRTHPNRLASRRLTSS